MRALVPLQVAAAEPAALGVLDWVVLVVAMGLTLMVANVAMRAAARSRRQTGEVPSTGFTLMKGASWLQAGAITLFGVAAVLLLWTLVLRLVQMG